MNIYAPKKKNLVITTIGKRALQTCKGWLGTDRVYDVILIYYDLEGVEDFYQLGDYIVVQTGFKYPSLFKIFQQHPYLLDAYDYFFLPDDDIIINTTDINALFDFARSRQITMCQPSLAPINYVWKVFVNNPDTEYRYVHMVEIMCPLFSQHALRKCLPSFPESQSGWALDPIWAKLLGNPLRGIAVFDGVVATHTNPSDTVNGHLYKVLKKNGISPEQESNALLKKYDVDLLFEETEFIYKEGFPKELSELLLEVKTGETIKDDISRVSLDLTLAFYLNASLIRVLTRLSFISVERLIGVYRSHMAAKTNEGVIVASKKLLYEGNKDMLLELIQQLFNEQEVIHADYPWLTRWTDLCSNEIKNQTLQFGVSEETLITVQKRIINSVNRQLKFSQELEVVLCYFIEQAFETRKSPV